MKFLIKLQNSFYSLPTDIKSGRYFCFVQLYSLYYLRPYLKFKCDFIKGFGFNV